MALYLEHFGLGEPPFRITPHPDFFFDGADRGATLEGLLRFGSNLVQADGLVRLRVENERAAPEIARWLVERGIEIFELRTARQSLEALFLEVMGDDQRPG